MPEVRLIYQNDSRIPKEKIHELAGFLPEIVARVLDLQPEKDRERKVKVDVYQPEYSVNAKLISVRISAGSDKVKKHLLEQKANFIKKTKYSFWDYSVM